MVLPKGGCVFLNALISRKLIPELVVTPDPFYIKNEFFLKQVIKFVAKKILFFFNRQKYKENFRPYFIAKEFGIRTFPSQIVHSEKCEGLLKQLDLDYIFVFRFKILKKNIFSIPKFGAINFHPAYLPRHRGTKPHFWYILNNERETGITFHFIDEGIDSGQIIEQYKIKISGFEDSKILYDYLYSLGANLFIQLIYKLMFNRKFTLKENKIGEGSYNKSQIDEFKIIDTSMTFSEISQTIKAARGYGFAHFYYNGSKYNIIDCIELQEDEIENNNFPIDDQNNFFIKTSDNKFVYLISSG